MKIIIGNDSEQDIFVLIHALPRDSHPQAHTHFSKAKLEIT